MLAMLPSMSRAMWGLSKKRTTKGRILSTHYCVSTTATFNKTKQPT